MKVPGFLRMKVLDVYIVRIYLRTFLFCILIFAMISMAFDFSDKVQAFIEKPCTVKNIMIDYYLGFLVHITALLLPIYTMIAVVFFTSRLAFNAEILSIFNAGISFQRLLRPYLIGGGIIALLHFSLNHFIVPKFNKSRLWFEHTFVWTDQLKVNNSNVHMLTGPETKIFVKNYAKEDKKISNLRLEYFKGSQILSVLEAETAIWKEDSKRWQLRNYTVHTFDGLHEKLFKFTTPLDSALNITPEDFVYFQNENQEMTTFELRDAINRDKARGLVLTTKSYEIEMHRRTADAATNIILTVIGLAVAGRKVRGGMGLHLALGIGIGAMFILLSKFTTSFAASGVISPFVAMWIPNLVFSIVAIIMVMRAQK